MTKVEKNVKVEILKSRLNKAKTVTAEFARKAAEDPFDALKWANSAIDAAADVRVLGVTMRNLEKGVSESDMLDLAKDYAKRLARNGHVRSTGALDAALHAEELRAWMMVAEVLETGDTL